MFFLHQKQHLVPCDLWQPTSHGHLHCEICQSWDPMSWLSPGFMGKWSQQLPIPGLDCTLTAGGCLPHAWYSLEGLSEGFYPKPNLAWFSQEELSSSTHWPQLQSYYCRRSKMPRRKTILNVVTWQVVCRFRPQGLRTTSRVLWPAEL